MISGDTSVDFNTVPVTNMVQVPQFCILKTVTSLISIRSKMQIHVHGFSVDNWLQDSSQTFLKLFNLLVVARIFKDHVNFIHVSRAQNPSTD